MDGSKARPKRKFPRVCGRVKTGSRQHIAEQMALTLPGMIKIEAGEKPFRRVASITETGRRVFRGMTDCLSLNPPERWVGGIRIFAGQPVWRFDEADGRVVGP